MPWNRIYMGNFWAQIFTELSRKSQDYISRKRGFHIKLMGPKSHWIPRKSSQNVKYWQNLTDLRYQAVKFHRLSSSRNLTESSRLNPTEWCFHGKIIEKLTQNFHRIPSLLNVSKPRKFSQNVTVETSQAFVIKPCNFTEHLPHGISQGRNLTEGLGGNFHWNAFFILHFSWQSPFFHTTIFTGFKVAEMFSTFLRYRESPEIHGTASFITLGPFTRWKQGCWASESSPIWIHPKIKLLFPKPCVSVPFVICNAFETHLSHF